jgi:ubiquinol-cytochrome c reductase subunit 9
MREHRDQAILELTTACSAVLRSNTTMLFTVFGAAFGLQLYVAMNSDTRGDRMLK